LFVNGAAGPEFDMEWNHGCNITDRTVEAREDAMLWSETVTKTRELDNE
jgi:hypothetical protein